MTEGKIYKLPDGAEVREADGNLLSTPTLANHSWVIHPTLGAISCYTGLLSPVTPPLPAEPPNGTVLSDGFNAVIRCDDQNNPGEGAWFMTGDKQTWSWGEVAPTITPDYRRYVPDPADKAPALPAWYTDHDEDALFLDGGGFPDHGCVIAVEVTGDSRRVHLTKCQAELAGSALLAAARRAREDGEPADMRAVRPEGENNNG